MFEFLRRRSPEERALRQFARRHRRPGRRDTLRSVRTLYNWILHSISDHPVNKGVDFEFARLVVGFNRNVKQCRYSGVTERTGYGFESRFCEDGWLDTPLFRLNDEGQESSDLSEVGRAIWLLNRQSVTQGWGGIFVDVQPADAKNALSLSDSELQKHFGYLSAEAMNYDSIGLPNYQWRASSESSVRQKREQRLSMISSGNVEPPQLDVRSLDDSTRRFVLRMDEYVSMQFAYVPGGEFTSRNLPTQKFIRLSPFYLGVFPVTQAQFRLRPHSHRHYFSGEGKERWPAENMTWYEANDYCDWLQESYAERMPAGYTACLPTDAQWQFATGATDLPPQIRSEYGWVGSNMQDGQTHEVGLKRVGKHGIYDCYGNVWEWCRDVFRSADHEAFPQDQGLVVDPVVSEVHPEASRLLRVIRGGSYMCGKANFDTRGGRQESYRFGDQGFRVCLTASS